MNGSLRNPKITILAIVFLAIHLLVFVWHLSKDLIYGDNSAHELIPSPRYEVWRIPDPDLTRSFQEQNQLAADFAQIYFPAQDESVSAHTDETLDPWVRPPRYAPILHELVHYIYQFFDSLYDSPDASARSKFQGRRAPIVQLILL